MALKWARWLHNPCSLGGTHRFKTRNLNKKKSRPITTALANPRTSLPSAKVRPRGRVGVKILFCAFHPFLNSPQNSEYFEYSHIGSNKKISPRPMPKSLKQNLRRLWRRQNTIFRTTILGSVEGGGGSPPTFGVGSRPGAAPVSARGQQQKWRTYEHSDYLTPAVSGVPIALHRNIIRNGQYAGTVAT